MIGEFKLREPDFITSAVTRHLTHFVTNLIQHDRREFLDLLKKMLVMDAEYRITPLEALSHPFITMSHFVDIANSSLVRSSVQKLEVCKRKVHLSLPVEQNGLV